MVTDGIFLLRNEDESASPASILAWPNGIFIFPAISSATLASLPLDVLSITCGGSQAKAIDIDHGAILRERILHSSLN